MRAPLRIHRREERVDAVDPGLDVEPGESPVRCYAEPRLKVAVTRLQFLGVIEPRVDFGAKPY